MKHLTFAEFDPTDGVTDPLAGDPDGAAPAEQPAPAEEPAWAGVSQQEWEDTQRYIRQIGPVLENLNAVLEGGPQPQYQQPQPQQQAPEFKFDPFDPTSAQAAVRAEAERLFDERMQMYEPVLGAFQAQQGEQLAREEFARAKSELGAPDLDEDTALLITAGMLGNGGDPRVAVSHAARYLSEYESRIRQNEREKYKAELQGLSTAPSEMPANTGAVQPPAQVPTGPDRYRRVVENWRAGQRPSMPVG